MWYVSVATILLSVDLLLILQDMSQPTSSTTPNPFQYSSTLSECWKILRIGCAFDDMTLAKELLPMFSIVIGMSSTHVPTGYSDRSMLLQCVLLVISLIRSALSAGG